MAPKRSRSGEVSSARRVVAPMSVKRRQGQAHAARARPLADDDVDREVLHRRVEHLLDLPVEAMDLVDEQDIALIQVGQDRDQIALALDGRAGGDLDATCISAAMIPARLVLPRPGGP